MMRRTLLCLALLGLTSPALGAGWVAQMEEDEGGAVMTASVEAPADGDVTPALRLTCAGDAGLGLRYQMAAADGAPGSEGEFLFENESTQARLHMAYEDMDGAFAAYFPPADPVVELLETGAVVYVSESSGNYPAQSFSLKGSSRAIAKLLSTCAS